MVNYLLHKIDATTMYRVVLYVLGGWAAYAFVLSALGSLYYTPIMLAASLVILVGTASIAHYILKWGTGAKAANIESTLITALILFFVFEPGSDIASLLSLAVVGVMAIMSKYIVKWRNVHIFNPVAFVIVLATLLQVGFSTWWIGTPAFFPVVLLGGFIIVKKIRRFPLALTAIGFGLASYLYVAFMTSTLSSLTLSTFFFSWPILFFATVMVTEPLSTPTGRKYQLWYAAFIGTLSALPFTIGPFENGFALSLLIANALTFSLMLTGRPRLQLKSVREVADHIYEYVFTPSFKFAFVPGQYLEWALPHKHPDNRGTRRYFTIASAPEEQDVVLGIKTYENSSTYKNELLTLQPGDSLYVSSLNGDFVLPDKPSETPVVFIAGGIGVTPFRSMVQHLLHTNTLVQATLFYLVRSEDEIAWDSEWEEATKIGLRTVYVVGEPHSGWQGESGRLTAEMIERHVINPAGSTYYLSGPPGMVRAYTTLLKSKGIKTAAIKRDYFPGLA